MKKYILFLLMLTFIAYQAKAQTYWKADNQNNKGDIVKTFNFSVPEPKTIQEPSVFSPLTANEPGFIPTQTFCKTLVTTSTTAAANLNALPAGFILSGGSSPKLTMIGNSGTKVANPAPATSRFASYDFADSTNIGSFHFKLNLGVEANNINANWYFMIGAGSSNPGIIVSTNSNPTIDDNKYDHDNRIFGEYKLEKSSKGGSFVHTTMDVTSLTAPSGRTWTPNSNANLSANKEYKIDIFCNNSNASQIYIMNGGEHNLARGTYVIYVDNVLKATLNKLTVTTNTGPIRSFSIFCREPSKSETGFDNSSSLTISDFKVVHLGDLTTNPVTLTNFTGSKTATGIALNWKTASEQNNSHFILNRSVNGLDFSYLTRVEGNGTTSNVNSYSYLDRNPAQGINYYQLEQVDNDGATTVIDKVVDVKYTVSDELFTVSKVSSSQLKAVILSEKNENVEFYITDVSGKVIYKSTKSLTAGNNQINVAIPVVTSGIYIATVKGSSQTQSVKLIL